MAPHPLTEWDFGRTVWYLYIRRMLLGPQWFCLLHSRRTAPLVFPRLSRVDPALFPVYHRIMNPCRFQEPLHRTKLCTSVGGAFPSHAMETQLIPCGCITTILDTMTVLFRRFHMLGSARNATNTTDHPCLLFSIHPQSQ